MTTAKASRMTYYGDDVEQAFDAALADNIRVMPVEGGKQSDPMGAPIVDNGGMYRALRDSLAYQGLFSDEGAFELKGTIVEVSPPEGLLDAGVTTIVRYVLASKQDGAVMFDKTIESLHVATFSDSPLGIERVRKANEASVKKNIAMFMSLLAKVKVTAPSGGAK